MAKIRTLKGEFFRNVEVSSCGITAKLLAAGLVLAVADDEGRFKAAPNYLLGEIFTHDATTPAEVATALERLQAVGFICLYAVKGVQLGALVSWKDHQRVPPSHFKESKFDAPPNTKRVRQMPSLLKQMSSPVTQERKGEEGKGVERKEGSSAGAEPSLPLDPPTALAVRVSTNGHVSMIDQVRQLHETWVVATNRDLARTVLTPERDREWRKALGQYPVGDVLDAAKGISLDAFYMGDNDRNRPFNEVKHVVKNLEYFRDLERGLVVVRRRFGHRAADEAMRYSAGIQDDIARLEAEGR